MKIAETAGNSTNFTFLRIPKQLLRDPGYQSLSAGAILVYGAMMDRANLSWKNRSRFTDDRGEVYIYFPQSEIMALLGCGHDKATKILKDLTDAGLITLRRRGIGRPYQIFLLPTDWRENKNERSEISLRHSEKTDRSLCGKPEINKNTNMNNTEYYIRDHLKNEIGYASLAQRYESDMIDRILDVAVSVFSQSDACIPVCGKALPADAVQERLRDLQEANILYVIRRIRSARYTTDHSHAFILDALFESLQPSAL